MLASARNLLVVRLFVKGDFMRTQEERRHLDEVAVSRQIEIAKTTRSLIPGSEQDRQPHRMAKQHATALRPDHGAANANPRHRSFKAKESLTVQELSAAEAAEKIESVDLMTLPESDDA